MAKIIGYRNEVPGDETTPVVECYGMTTAEQSYHAAADILRETTKDLRAQLKKAEEAQMALFESCAHHLFIDTAGFTYSTRRCVICGCDLGLV
jgi:hypothetical protein